MITILAEKPDVGNKIAAALDCIVLDNGKKVTFDTLRANEKAVKALQSKQGYLPIKFDGQDCCVTWGFGHLVELKQAKDYNPDYANWSKMPMPFIPTKYETHLKQLPKNLDKYGYNEKVKKQFNIIKDLFNKSSYVINATDFDREGEVIFSYIYDLANCKRPIKRAKFTSQTKDGIQDGFYKNLVDGSQMELLRDAGKARSIADAVVGYNLTAAITLKSNTQDVISVGRVQTPTLNMTVLRELAITGFTSAKYYTVSGNFVDTNTKSKTYTGEHSVKRFDKKDDAEKVIAKIKGQKGVVEDVKKTTSFKSVPNLYSLSSLQMDANAKYGYTLKTTLEIAQKLYDNGLTTYPRTNSQFLTEDMRPVINATLDKLIGVPEYESLIVGKPRNFDNRFFNNSKVEGHFAIIPTGKLASGLPTEEKNIYDLIARSVIRMLYSDAKLEKTNIITDVVGEKFSTNGTRIVDEGWMVCGDVIKENILPDMVSGEQVDGEYVLNEKDTTPPKRYTDKTLLAAMLTAGKDIDDESLKKAMETLDVKGIGTEATRANIIETLIQRGYIERKGKTIYATKRGIEVIQALPIESLKSAALTAEWETKFDDIAKGKCKADTLIHDIENATKEWCDEISKATISITGGGSGGGTKTASSPNGATTTSLVCPICGNPIVKYKWGWGCSNYKNGCKFSVGKILGKSITEKNVKALVEKGETPVIKGFVSKKTGKPFDAKLVLDKASGAVSFSFK